MEPFGPQNMSPVFQTDQVYIESYPEKLRENHLKLRLKQQNSSIFEAVGFGLADFHTLLKPGQPFSVCYTIDRNVWKNEATLQLNLKDIRLGP
jgi:single-stranded-DNA-specific exonuclease